MVEGAGPAPNPEGSPKTRPKPIIRGPGWLLAALVAVLLAVCGDPEPDGLTPTDPGDREAAPVQDGGLLAADTPVVT